MNCCEIVIYDEPVTYDAALELQRSIHSRVLNGQSPSTLLLLQHPPTITLGRKSHSHDLLVDRGLLESHGTRVIETDRGGAISYHAPGQLVGYPIIDLNRHNRDIHQYIRQLEQTLISVLNEFKILSETVPGLTGVWIKDRKIAAIGVKVSKWITMHGFSLNISNDLSPYGRDFIQCGLYDSGVTSMQKILGGDAIPMRTVAEMFALQFTERYSYSASFASPWV